MMEISICGLWMEWTARKTLRTFILPVSERNRYYAYLRWPNEEKKKKKLLSIFRVC